MGTATSQEAIGTQRQPPARHKHTRRHAKCLLFHGRLCTKPHLRFKVEAREPAGLTLISLQRKSRGKNNACLRRQRIRRNGFGMAEAVVSLGAGTLVIGASAAALHTTGSLISNTEDKTHLRQNAWNGERLMRKEVERGLHLLIATTTAPSGQLADTNLNSEQYAQTLGVCKNLAETRMPANHFLPVFGIRMASLDEPIIYGISSNRSGNAYTLERCGVPLEMDGRYGEVANVFLSSVIEDIGVMPCADSSQECERPKNSDGSPMSLNDVLKQLDFSFQQIDDVGERTPNRGPFEPALAIQTDANRKLVKFVDPNSEAQGEYSYLESTNNLRSLAKLDLHFSAYARASTLADDNTENLDDDNTLLLDGSFFRNIHSKQMRFLVDGSGSMSACILWGSGRGKTRTYWNGDRYIRTRKICALTRMESLQSELLTLINQLPNDTRISIDSFSSDGYLNHRGWQLSKENLVTIGQTGARQSAARFINSLNDGDVRRWGGTEPWKGLDKALADINTDTLYFLSDGEPSTDRNGASWGEDDYLSTVKHYSDLNKTRNPKISINTTALGINSSWMKKLSKKNDGSHLMIDKDYITVAQQ